MGTSTARAHTTNSGIDPYDKDFGILGPQKHSGESAWSPYERINRLRKIYQETPYTVDTTRLRIITEVYRNNESLPVVLKKALALKKFMEECQLSYIEGELLLLDDGSPIFAMNIFPELVHWMFNEMESDTLRTRSYMPHNYDEKTKEEVLAAADYWQGKDVATTFRSRLPKDAAKGCAVAGGMLVINANVNVDMGVGHTTMDFARLLEKGLGGLKAYVREYKDRLGLPVTDEGARALELYEAQLIVLDAWSNYFRRYAAFAREQMKEYSSQQTKDELQSMSEICEHLAEGAPRTFWEAVMLHHAACQVYFMESNGGGLGMGRMDCLLYPFYKADMEKGAITKDFVQQLLDCLYLRNEATDTGQFPTNDLFRIGMRGSFGGQVVVGGVDADGNDVTNDLSFMLLDAAGHVRQAHPILSVRYHEGTPYELKVKVAEIMRLGIGHPKILNDRVAIDALQRMGCSLEDARDYVNIGCVEMGPAGKSGGWLDAGGVNLPKILELALNNGKCLDCAGEQCPNYNTQCRGAGKSLGLETGYLKDFKTFDEVLAAYQAQLKYWADRAVLMCNVLQAACAERDDAPVMSLLVDGCIESGKSWVNGGAKYNHAGFQSLGPATTADSLTALKKLVYEDKKYTAEEFYDALTKNWEGHERLYQLVNSDKVPHYGNDDDYADEMMQYVHDTYCNLFQSYPPSRGIWKIVTGSFSSILNVLYGLAVGATPDGRKHHEVVSANIEPARTVVSHRDKSGPTALARSIGKLDHGKCSTGTLVNMKFGTDTVSGEQGRENLVDFLDAYFAQNPLHIQVMVTNRETLLEARAKPEEYKDLIVRVSGFSSYFHSLSEGLQDELINRTEQSFD